MKKISNLAGCFRKGKDTRDQGLIEYAMLAGFVAVGAGSFIFIVTSKIGIILLMIGRALSAAGA